MKTAISCLLFFFCTYIASAQQAFKVGVHGGVPLGLATETYASNFIADVDVIFHMTRNVQFGATAGANFLIHEEINGDRAEHLITIPVGGVAQYNFSERFAISTDIAYSIVLQPDFVDGGLYLAPKGHVIITENLDVILAYRALLTNGETLSAATIGLEYGFY